MTQDEIIRMAREAGLPPTEWVFNFAALVAAHEREACAKVCEEEAKSFESAYLWDEEFAVKNCAAAIRARGEK